MVRSLILLALGASACAEPVIELSFQMPTADRGGAFNASCLTAVDIYTNGTDYPTTTNDFVRSCVEITSPPATLAELKSAIAGKIDVRLPESGLASVEILGRRGSCTLDDSLPFGDLVFYAGANYIGDDQLVLPVDASSSCDQAPVTVRPIDLIKLTTGTTRGDCAAAKAIDGPNAGADIGTLMPSVANGVMWTFGRSGAFLINGVATIPAASMTVGPKACLAVSSGDAVFGSVTCVDRSLPPVCATPGEIEAPGVSAAIAIDSFDQAKKSKFPSVIYGAVVNGTKQPIQGATVEIDSKIGEVVYVELSGTRLVPTGGTATGASGLFMVYTSTVASVKVSSGALSRTTTVGALADAEGGVLVMLR